MNEIYKPYVVISANTIRNLERALEAEQNKRYDLEAKLRIKESAVDEWSLDEYGCWIFKTDKARVWLQARPPYCDRGHWMANVDGVAYIDHADSFPRYFMDLDRAKLEMQEWLIWRLRQDGHNV